MDKRDLELVVEHQRLTAQFLSLSGAGAEWDSPDLVAVSAQLDRVGDELLSRLPPSPPLPAPQWLLDRYPKLANLSGQKFPSRRSRLLRPLVRVAKPVMGAYSRLHGRWRRWWINKRDGGLWQRYQVLSQQAHALAVRGVAAESAEVLALSAQIDRVAEEILRRLR